MEKVYIFGHRNPDTDSVTAAIALSYLKKKLGINAIPVILSSVNRETKYVLNYFKVKEPMFLNDVKIKVKDLEYSKDYMVTSDCSLYDAYNKMNEASISKIPVVDKYKHVLGMISMKDIVTDYLSDNYFKIDTEYKNILNTINGTKVLKFDNIIKGNLIINNINDKVLDTNSIYITDKCDNSINTAISSKVRLIIITNNLSLSEEYIKLAKQNKINIIKTKYNIIETIKLGHFCNSVSTIINNQKIYTVNEYDDLTNFISIAEKTKYTYYPIIDNQKKCIGIVKATNAGYHNKKKVILVDHNSYEQSAIGLEESEILEVIDHHNISTIGTNRPINFRNMPVGSTNTIIYQMYKENNVKIPADMAGLMLSGILSDTLILNSPTTTNIDKDAVNNLSRIAKVDYKQYGFEMISYGTNLIGKTKEEILYNDFKKYPTNNGTIGLGQINTTNIKEIEKEKEEYIKMLNKVAEMNEYKFVALLVTDIINKSTYVYYSDSGKEILSSAFNREVTQGFYLEGILSRKMQILPNILDIMN